ncbi:MAG: DUF2892 domain-containing protein [Gammaproteobacteria bacterium]|nr:DUF2892 domain-containing protein [Gammaproteobacteria bacterium]
MERNISRTDRTFRLLFGIAIALYVLLTLEYEYFIWGLVALFPIITAIISWCPIQYYLGLKDKKCYAPSHSITTRL